MLATLVFFFWICVTLVLLAHKIIGSNYFYMQEKKTTIKKHTQARTSAGITNVNHIKVKGSVCGMNKNSSNF